MTRHVKDPPHRFEKSFPALDASTTSSAKGGSVGVQLTHLPQEVLEHVGGYLTAHAWLQICETSQGMRAALHTPAVVRAIMAAQSTPPPVIEHLLPPDGDVTTAVAHVTAKQLLLKRLTVQPANYQLHLAPNCSPRILVHPDGLGFLQWSRPRAGIMDHGSPRLLFTRLDAAVSARPLDVRLGTSAADRGIISDVVFSPNGRQMFVATAAGSLIRMQRDDRTGGFVSREVLLQGGPGAVEEASLALSPSGNSVLMSRHRSGRVALVDTETGRVLFDEPLLRQPPADHRDRCVAAYLDDSEVLLIDHSNGVHRARVSAEGKVEVKTVRLELPPFSVLSLHHHPMGGVWVEQSGPIGEDGPVYIGIRDPHTLMPFEGPTADPTTQQSFPAIAGAQYVYARSGEQRVFAKGLIEATWPQSAGSSRLEVTDGRGATLRKTALKLPTEYGDVTDVALSPDGHHLAVAQGRTHLWLVDLDQASPLLRQIGPPQQYGAPKPRFSPDGALLFSQDGSCLHVHTVAL